MLRVHEPHNQVVLDRSVVIAGDPTLSFTYSLSYLSILGQPIEDLILIACDPSGSRVLDVILETPTLSSESAPSQTLSTIPFKARKRLIMRFLESDSFITLVDDKLGSRVADRCWAVADPYLRVSCQTI